MNWEMVKGALERVATVVVTAAVAKGIIPAAVSADVVLLLITLASIGYGVWINRQAALVQAAASMPQVAKVVVDDPQLARETTKPGAAVTTNVLWVCVALGAAAVVLSACDATTSPAGPKPAAITPVAAKVQAYTKQACGYVPVAATVNALLVQNQTFGDLAQLASQICAAVQLNPMTEGPRGGRTKAKLRGVTIEGRFVR